MMECRIKERGPNSILMLACVYMLRVLIKLFQSVI